MYPQKSVPGSQEVYTNHITEGNEDIFLLRVKKKSECPDQKNRNIELELRTPKAPQLPKPPTLSPTQFAVTLTQPEAATDLIVEDVKEPSKKSKKLKKKLKRKTKKNSRYNAENKSTRVRNDVEIRIKCNCIRLHENSVKKHDY